MKGLVIEKPRPSCERRGLPRVLSQGFDSLFNLFDLYLQLFEPYRVCRRANSLRGWPHGTTESIFP